MIESIRQRLRDPEPPRVAPTAQVAADMLPDAAGDAPILLPPSIADNQPNPLQ